MPSNDTKNTGMPGPDAPRCNARLRSGTTPEEKAPPGQWAGEGHCQRPAGEGTPHKGEGRCKLHGGANVDGGRPVEHGLRSQLSEDLREFVTQAASMDNPGDLTGELAMLRGLLFRWLGDNDGLDRDAIEAAHKLLKEIRRTSDTIHKQMTRERLTKDEEQQLLDACASIIRQYVPDGDTDDALTELRQSVGAGGGQLALEGRS